MDGPAPRISFIIATRNAAKTLARCLDSILNQSFRQFEIVVADGLSSDDTLDVIQTYERHLSHWHSRADAGIYDAWNQALEHAQGEYVCFLGADDALSGPHVLEDMFARIGASEYALVSSQACLRDAHWRPQSIVGKPFDHASLPRRMMLSHPGLLHRRNLFEVYGNFDSTYRIAADLDFLLRLPPDTATLHLDFVTVNVQDDGISRRRFWLRIKERRAVHAQCPRVGVARAWLYWADKVWRRPVALLLGLPH